MNSAILANLELHLSNLRAQAEFLNSLIAPHTRPLDGDEVAETMSLASHKTIELVGSMEALKNRMVDDMTHTRSFFFVKTSSDHQRPENLRAGFEQPPVLHALQAPKGRNPHKLPSRTFEANCLSPTRRKSTDSKPHVENLRPRRGGSSTSDDTATNNEQSKLSISDARGGKLLDSIGQEEQEAFREDELIKIAYEDISDEVARRIKIRESERGRSEAENKNLTLKRKQCDDGYEDLSGESADNSRSELLWEIGSPHKKHRSGNPIFKRKQAVLGIDERRDEETSGRALKKMRLADTH